MTKRLLIDATHAEETRVVVLDGNRLEDFDVETQTRRQLKGNIYLAKVVRVEPSLQAAFVEYGGNRHGFLAFGEIHPDYYQIPVADRQRLLEMQEEEARAEEAEEDAAATRGEVPAEPPSRDEASESPDTDPDAAPLDAATAATVQAAISESGASEREAPAAEAAPEAEFARAEAERGPAALPAAIHQDVVTEAAPALTWPASEAPASEAPVSEAPVSEANGHLVEEERAPFGMDVGELGADLAPEAAEPAGADEVESVSESAPPPETIGGEGAEERQDRRPPPRFMRHYKIQEVIRRRQILLVQVVKEERGTKGAALTTYISLAGRFSVLMPNSPRGGGISRKITSAADRRRLKEITTELDIPRGMGLIVRTAGANRPKPEIKRDCEYLLRLWDDIRDRTMQSVAPALIYEEADLIKRSIRDVYSRDVDEVVVDGEEGWKAARDFMRMLMPTHARKVQLWKDGGQPLFAKSQVEAQLDAMLSPNVQLKSGGYLVINQAEALVAIDVNSGRSTRERGIEETALRTNLEAADEAARQLRLRDLAGLIVIDFIDMESKKHNAMVERRLKEALKNDRARIQVGHISHFGLLEMSRQRLRPSLAETSFVACPHCGGTGHVRSTESGSLHVLRAIEEEGGKRRAAEIVVHVHSSIAFYILNHKRQRLSEIEARYAMHVSFAADDGLIPPQLRIDRVRAQTADALPPAIRQDSAAERQDETEPARAAPAGTEWREASEPRLPPAEADASEEPDVEEDEEDGASASREDAAGPGSAEEAGRRRRRRRRRRGGRREDGTESPAGEAEAGEPGGAGVPAGVGEGLSEAADAPVLIAEMAEQEAVPAEAAQAPGEDEAPRGRRRGRRGGRRRRPDEEAPEDVAEPAEAPAYSGPTPADPFGGQVFDIFDVMEQVEQRQALPAAEPAPAAEPVRPEYVPESEQIGQQDTDRTEFAFEAGQPLESTPEPMHVPEPAPEDIAAAAAPAPNGADLPAPAEPDVASSPEPETEPAIKPVIIGAGEPVAEKKRGWWRR